MGKILEQLIVYTFYFLSTIKLNKCYWWNTVNKTKGIAQLQQSRNCLDHCQGYSKGDYSGTHLICCFIWSYWENILILPCPTFSICVVRLRGWDGWMASLTRRTWVWASSGVIPDEQGSLACCSPWGRRESCTTEWLKWLTVVGLYQKRRGLCWLGPQK